MPLCSKKNRETGEPPIYPSHFLKGKLRVHIIEACYLPHSDWCSKSDPFAILKYENQELCRTRTLDNTCNPYWNEYFSVPILGPGQTFTLEVFDDDLQKPDSLGLATISVEDFLTEGETKKWVRLKRPNKATKGQVHIQLSYGSDNGETTYDIPQVYFQTHKNCRLTPFQDAVVDNGFAARIGLSEFDRSCWRCLYVLLMRATKCIYIAGWSVWVHTKLTRFRTKDNQAMIPEPCLGELLKKKASEGVLVYVLIWDDAMSRSWTDKLSMGTHDEETLKYFQDSEVICAKVPKGGRKTGGVSDVLFTHHQKIVVMDMVDAENKGSRRLAAFIGGLDLADGRFDSPTHALFSTLQHEHLGDYHQGMLPTSADTPRQPWHDIHTMVEGSVVNDIVQAYCERWVQLAPDSVNRIISPFELSSLSLDTPFDGADAWNLQIFQSRDSNCAKMARISGEVFPLDFGISFRSGIYVDDSCLRAYVHLIRGAQRSIYLENQYFLGSSPFWENESDASINSVPAEIAYRIVDRIKAGRPFHAYILIPMWPEGPAKAGHVQHILQSQNATMKFMYKVIAEALTEQNSSQQPLDYLTFYCLGNRDADEHPSKKASKSKSTRRSPIYVHSKLGIFDDTYLLCGSANINDRSLRGYRDTEILVGGHQPALGHRGVVHNFRRALFLEHLGHSGMVYEGVDTFQDLADPSCVQAVGRIAEANWQLYTQSENVKMTGHLMPYPIVWSPDGSLSARVPKFPDTDASVVGSYSSVLPTSLCA